jgi:hypothetical protein
MPAGIPLFLLGDLLVAGVSSQTVFICAVMSKKKQENNF